MEKVIEIKNNKYKHDCLLFVILRPCNKSNTLAYSFTTFSDNGVTIISDVVGLDKSIRTSRETRDLIKDIIAKGILYANSLGHSSVYIKIASCEAVTLGTTMINMVKSHLYNEWKVNKKRKFVEPKYKTIQGHNLKALEDIIFSSNYLSPQLRTHYRKQEKQLGNLISVRAKRKRWKERRRVRAKEDFIAKHGKNKRSITNEE